ncbi:hypothetical protein GGI06_002919, partial [Coemansia sp. S85]
MERVTIQSVDTFKSGSIGFVKLSSDAHFNGTRIPGVVFLRGPSTAVLLILRTQEGGRVPSRLDGGYAVMVEQPRVAAGEALLELPAGMDDGVCTAVKEVMEETGVAIEEGDLVELGAAYPSPGACDEMVTLCACEKAVTSDELERVRGRLGGCRSEGELITVRLVRISDLWQTTDMKTLAAFDDELLASLLHSTQSPAATARAFKALADQCQDAETRLRLTEQPLLAQALSAVLQRTLADLSGPEELSEPERADRMLLLVQTLRCMGNVSADNSGGRAQLLEHGGVTGIARVLSGVAEVLSEPLLMRAAFGAALNAALDTADNARALIAGGALEPHLRALSMGPPCDAWAVVCMSLDSLCESDEAVAAFEQDAACMASVLGTLGALARVEGPLARGAMRTLVWVLCETVEKSAAVRIQLCTPDAVLALFDLL